MFFINSGFSSFSVEILFEETKFDDIQSEEFPLKLTSPETRMEEYKNEILECGLRTKENVEMSKAELKQVAKKLAAVGDEIAAQTLPNTTVVKSFNLLCKNDFYRTVNGIAKELKRT